MNIRFLTIPLTLLLSALSQPLAISSQPPKSQELVVIGQIVNTASLPVKNASENAGKIQIKTDSGKTYQLESDEAARLFFLDSTMTGRKARLRIQTRPEKPAVTTINVEIEHEGRWRVPQYYCDVCTIAVRYPQICLCCQGPMEFRFKPER